MNDSRGRDDLLRELLATAAASDDEAALSLENFGLRLAYAAATRRRVLAASGLVFQEIRSACDDAPLTSSIQETAPARAPWRTIELADDPRPSMVTPEERQFFEWIGRFYSGTGAVLELGPWLGSSTRAILRGLRANPRFDARRLCVVDDFTWRGSWMDPYVPEQDRCQTGKSFRHLFERHMHEGGVDCACLDIRRASIVRDAFNAAVDVFAWDDGPIELAFIDCGRTFQVNEAWFARLSPHFIPGKTLLVMQDWRLFESLPRVWFNQTREFTESKHAVLREVVELAEGMTAAFAYVGPEGGQ